MRSIILILLMFCSVLSFSQDIGENITQDPLYGEKLNIKFNYFRIANFSNKVSAMDVNGIIWLNDKWLVVKSNSFGVPDKMFKFKKKIKIQGKNKKAWKAYPFGAENENIYIEYKKGEYILILFVAQHVTFYFIDSSLKDETDPFPSYGVWYEKTD